MMNEGMYAQGPVKTAFELPDFSLPQQYTLKNGVHVYSVFSPETETLKMEWVFDAGSVFAQKVLQSAACAELLNKGTAKKTGYQINEALDYYGSYFSADSGRDEITLRLFTLRRFFSDVLPIVAELFFEAVYPEEEFSVWLDAKKSAFQINSQKTDYVASARFPSVLFGADSPYGTYLREGYFEGIHVDDARAYHRQLLKAPFRIFISGHAPDDWLTLTDTLFGEMVQEKLPAVVPFSDSFIPQEKVFFPVENSVQHALVIGRRLLVREADEYARFMVTNTLLGGYFGSRLMSNLREKNGYTYGVSSYLSRMRFSDVWKISTDVGTEVAEAACREIFTEVDRLCGEKADNAEIQRVITYINGSFLRSFDGPQAIMDRFKTLVLYGLPLDFFETYTRRIQAVSAEDILATAQHYLTGLSTVTAGSSGHHK
jgi:predicted Zn-dependent peptidase